MTIDIENRKRADVGERIEVVAADDDIKTVPACPACGWSHPSARKTKLPKYRCKGCGHEFPEKDLVRRVSRQGGS